MDSLLFGALPYLFLIVGIAGAIYRYNSNRFSWSSQSSEFLENKTLFYGSVPWHYGILTVLVMHIIGFFIPSGILAWNSVPARLYFLEISGLAFGISALFGLLALIFRRLSDSRAKAVTSNWDVLVLIVLLIQVVTGLINATAYRWGSNWYAATAVPYLWSLVKFSPNVSYIENLPLLTKVHIFNFMIFIGIIPFTRLVHFLVINPYKYLVRPYQVVRWYGNRGRSEAIVQYK